MDTPLLWHLTAAALLSPALQPPEIQSPLRVDLPPCLRDYCATVHWAKEIYRRHRGRSAEVSPGSAP